jgi:hypothetical protein
VLLAGNRERKGKEIKIKANKRATYDARGIAMRVSVVVSFIIASYILPK